MGASHLLEGDLPMVIWHSDLSILIYDCSQNFSSSHEIERHAVSVHMELCPAPSTTSYQVLAYCLPSLIFRHWGCKAKGDLTPSWASFLPSGGNQQVSDKPGSAWYRGLGRPPSNRLSLCSQDLSREWPLTALQRRSRRRVRQVRKEWAWTPVTSKASGRQGPCPGGCYAMQRHLSLILKIVRTHRRVSAESRTWLT
jgi:hypothetical protein